MTDSHSSEQVAPQPPPITPSDDTQKVKVLDDELISKGGETAINADKKESIENSKSRDELLTPLAKQLLYYFSVQNLSSDTYLKTMMDLNSGFVPVSILSNFANISRIITDSLSSEENIYSVDVPGLLRQAALRSEYLEVSVLNQQGKIITTDNDGNYQLEQGRLNFFGIGPSSSRPTEYDTTKPLRKDSKQQIDKLKSDSANIIILRDVPQDATEEDIRAIFQNNTDSSCGISDVQREIGNCWFVTCAPMERQQDMVDMLLSIRNKKIHGEPIKARLKTQRKASTSAPPPVKTIAPQSSGFNPYRAVAQNKSGGSPSRGYGNQIYSGDRVYYGGKKHYSSGKGGGGVSNRNPRNARGNASSHTSESTVAKKANGVNQKSATRKDKPVPPPSCKKNFPSLGINSPRSTIVTNGENALGPNKEGTLENIVVEEEVTPVPYTISAKKITHSTGGYAAALLKIVPSVEITPSTTKTESTPLPTLNASKKKVGKVRHYVCCQILLTDLEIRINLSIFLE